MVGREREMQCIGLQTQNEQLNIVRTYCDRYGSSHGAWKLRRQSYDTDRVSQGPL